MWRVSVTFLFLLVLVFLITTQTITHASLIPPAEPAQYTFTKLVGLINGNGKPKLQVGFNNIFAITIIPSTGQMVAVESGAVKQFSLDSPQALVSVIPGLVGSTQSFISNNDGSEFYYYDQLDRKLKRWKDGVVSVIAGNGVSDYKYYPNETLATETYLSQPSKLVYVNDCLYMNGYGISKLNLTTGMISTFLPIDSINDFAISNGYLYHARGNTLTRCLLSDNCQSAVYFSTSSLYIYVIALAIERDEFYFLSNSNIYQFNMKSGNSTVVFTIQNSLNLNQMVYRNNMLYYVEGVRIRKVNLMNNSISDEAGNGYYGFVQENVPSQQAGITSTTIQSITLKNEELYYTDSYNIKKIDKNGIVRRVAGTGTFSTLSNEKESIALQTNIIPNSLSVSKKGELHFVDSGYIVRKVSDNGNVSYVGGNPYSVVFEGNATTATIYPNKIIQVDNELIICEGQRIRKVSSEGIISTIVGGGNNPFQEGALATNISITSLTDCLYNPKEKSIYYIDSGLVTLKVNSNNSVTMFSSDSGSNLLGVDGNGLIYLYNTQSIRINKVNPDTLETTVVYQLIERISISTGLSSVSNNGDVYFVGNCQINLIQNGVLMSIAGIGVPSCESSNIIVDGMNATQLLPYIYSLHYSNYDNQLYFSTTNGIWKLVDGFIFKVFQSVSIYNLNSTDSSKFIGTAPTSLSVSSNGDFLFIDSAIVRKYNVQQDVIENVYIGDGSYGPFTNVSASFLSTTFCENQLYAVSSKGIRLIDSETSIMTPITLSFQLASIRYISCLNNNLYFMSVQSIKKLSLSDGNIENIAGTPGLTGQTPDGSIAKNSKIAPGPLFKPYILPNQEVLYYESLKLRKIGLDGRWQTIAGNGVSGTSPDFAVNSKNVALSTIVTSFAYSELSGKIYFSSNGIYELSPYCRDGYQFENSFKTTCVPINCFGKLANDSSVCSSRGVCVGIDNCQCSNLYISSDCSVSLCQTESGKQNTILCPQTNTPTSGNTVTQPTLNVTESKTEIVKDLTQIDSKNITFTSTNSIQITLPSTISNYVSNQVSKNETIQIISAISEKTQIVKPQTSNSGSEQTNEISTIEVVSKVVSLILLKQDGQKIQVSNLINPITFTFTNLIIKSTETLNLTCSYLDEFTKEWKSDGLTTNINQITNLGNEQQQVTINCETNHLTSFAVIDMNLKKGNTLKDNVSITTDNTVLIAAVVSSVVGVFILVSVISIIIIASICLIRRRKATSKE